MSGRAWLFGNGEDLLASIHAVLVPADKLAYDWVWRGCAQLGEEAFAAAWVEGRAMAPELGVEKPVG